MTAVNSTTLPRLPDHLLIAQPFNHRLCVVALSFAWDMYDSCHDWPGVCDQISREFLLNLRETAWLEDFGGDIDMEVGRRNRKGAIYRPSSPLTTLDI